MSAPGAAQGRPETASAAFDPAYRAKARGTTIVGEAELASVKSPSALVRLGNQKLALMVRDESGRLRPFYVRGLGGVGYWNTARPTPEALERTFSDFSKLAVNTALFGIHWRDIEPADGQFDFKFTDSVAQIAARHGVKIWWVLFMHFQPDRWPELGLDKFWVYHLDDRDGANYTVQWLKDENGNVYNSIDKLLGLDRPSEVFPAYGHPKVFPRILRMLGSLARHYKDSTTVIGLQLGNEEGFNLYPGHGRDIAKMWETDYNPFTLEWYERWKQLTGKSDWVAFRVDTVKYWWTRFTTAYHDADPYKLISFNLLGGAAESHEPWAIRAEGADSTLYGEGNLDVVGSMLYRDQAALMWPNLDQHYDYVFHRPILIPSEIGLRPQDSRFQNNVIAVLERGGQGFGIWSYARDMVGPDSALSTNGKRIRNLDAMIEANEDVLYGGLPGPGDVAIQASGEAKASQLHTAAATLGIVHLPGAVWEENAGRVEVAISIKALKAGKYNIVTFRNGEKQPASAAVLAENETKNIIVPDFLKTEAIFLKVVRAAASSK
jgi:hypothetical protein